MGFGSTSDERSYNQISLSDVEEMGELEGAKGRESREPDVRVQKFKTAW